MNGRFFLILAFFCTVLLLIGCNETDTPVYTTMSEPELTAGEPIPIPNDEIILTVTGAIGTTNQDESIVMDIATIELLGQVEYSVHDPFVERQIVYTGVLMQDLLDLWQISDEATSLQMTALNDYQVDVPLDLLRDYPVIFALQADGDYMPVVDKGPAMLVFPYDDFEFEQPGTNQYWVWQIKTIHVE